VLTTSRKISERLIAELGLDAARVTTLPTGIDLERFNAGVHGVLHHELKLPPSTPLVGMVSVLRSWKGHKFFIEAAAEVLRRQPDARFVIVGDGPGRERIANQIAAAGLAGKVVMLGHRDDVPGVLASLSVLVLPSTAHEGVPQIILQAQAMDRAAVGTTVGGIPEVVRDGETGLLVPPQDGAALAEKILLLLAQPDFSHQLGRAAGECARRECGLDAMCARLEEIYAAQLDGRGAAQA
jgi:glycosyltransferase involved in cell wall biosynthesis